MFSGHTAFCYVYQFQKAQERPKRFQDWRQWPACEAPKIRIDGPQVLKPEPLVSQALSSATTLLPQAGNLAPPFSVESSSASYFRSAFLDSTKAPTGPTNPLSPQRQQMCRRRIPTPGALVTERIPEGLLAERITSMWRRVPERREMRRSRCLRVTPTDKKQCQRA